MKTFNLYVVRRKDTGEFYNWTRDDLCCKRWNSDLGLATLYPLNGAKLIVEQLIMNCIRDPQIEYEIVRLKVMIDGVEPTK